MSAGVVRELFGTLPISRAIQEAQLPAGRRYLMFARS